MGIDAILTRAPALKARHAEIAENMRYEWQILSEKLRLLEAKTYLLLKTSNDGLKVADLEAMVRDTVEVYDLRLEVIKKESDYRREVVKINKADDYFTGAKIMARLQLAQLKGGLE